MPIITFQPSGKSSNVPKGTALLDSAKKAEVEIDSPCGGSGACGYCRVRVASKKIESENLGVLTEEEIGKGFVLACQTHISDSKITVDVPEQVGLEGGKFAEAFDAKRLVRQDLMPEKQDLKPLAVKLCVNVPEPQLGDGFSDSDRLMHCLQKELGHKDIQCSLAIIRKVADSLRANNGCVTVTVVRDTKPCHIVNIEPGDRKAKGYGIAIDVGTTTVAVQLILLSTGDVVATQSDYNDQIPCGLDVISRINYAKRPDRLEELRTRILGTINRLTEQAMEEKSIKSGEILCAAISGNTTMTHLLLGIKPEYIRLSPYTPTIHQAPYLTAKEIGININPLSCVFISPSIGSYVGGDITSGILCTDLAKDTNSINLFMDIGTNGELVAGNRDFLMACACSAGPAFEGGGINCGIRASHGAIERVEINRNTGVAHYWTIGNVKPIGTCGSGMISLLADLYIKGWIDASGKLNRSRNSSAITVNGRRACYEIVSSKESGTGKPLTISEPEIESLIRAKAAVYSALSLMLKQLEIDFKDLAGIYIAGGFGRFLDLEKAKIIGLIPDLPREKFHYVGNASLTGTYMSLVSQKHRDLRSKLAKRMTYLELNTDPSYMDQYTAALFLPHTNAKLFPSVNLS